MTGLCVTLVVHKPEEAAVNVQRKNDQVRVTMNRAEFDQLVAELDRLLLAANGCWSSLATPQVDLLLQECEV